MNKTEELEANLAKIRTNQFINTHQILTCLEQTKDRLKCHDCKDFPICWKFRDMMSEVRSD